MNQIAAILTKNGIDPNIIHSVKIQTKSGNTVTRAVTPLGHGSETMVARLDYALIANQESIEDILNFTGDQPQVYLRRITAPNRKSELNTETLLTSWTEHIKWLSGTKSHKNLFIDQFTKCFGEDKKQAAIEISNIAKEYKTKIWNPQHKKYVQDLRKAILDATATITDDTIVVEPPAVIEPLTCTATTKAGNPCKGKAIKGSAFCANHQPKVPATI